MDLREREKTKSHNSTTIIASNNVVWLLADPLCVPRVYVYHILGVISVETDFVTRSSRISFEKLHLMRVSNETLSFFL